MKSKISYFNKTIFWKNVTLYWPIWGVYSFILMCIMPFYLWLEYNDGYRTTPLTSAQKFSRLCGVLELTPIYTFIIAFTAVIIGMALFNYLYNSKSANMIHSLPVNRTELFGTNVISGIAFLAVPQIVVFVMTLLICLTEGVYQVEYLALWLLVVFATDIIAFSVVTCCAMFTGLTLALPFYVGVVNSLAYMINMLLELIVSTFGYGVNYHNLISDSLLIWLSPFSCFMENVYMIGVYKNNGSIREMQLLGLECIIIYLIMAVVLYAIAYFVYQKRQIEKAGDLITVGFVKPIFRCGVGAIVAMYGSFLIRAIFMEFGMEISLVTFIIMLLVIGTIAYFIADMFVRKTFRVFKKKNWKNCAVFLMFLLVGFGAMYTYAEVAEHKLPKEEDVKYAYTDMGYMVRYEGDDISVVTDVHEKILDNLSEYQKLDETNYYWDYDFREYENINIYYVMKDGEAFYRSYRVPVEGEGKDIIDVIYSYEQKPENFLKNEFCNNYEAVTTFSAGYIDFQYYVEGGSVEYYTQGLAKTHIKTIYDAIIADAMAGNLMKYNTYYMSSDYESDKYNSTTYYIQFDFEIPNTEDEKNFWDYYNEQYNQFVGSYAIEADMIVGNQTGIAFGKDCTNIINALYECGIINEAWKLFWGEELNWEQDSVFEFLHNSLGFDIDYYEIDKFYDGAVYFARYETNENGEKVYNNERIVLTESQVKQLYYEAIGDIKEGRLYKYNPDYAYWEDKYAGDESVFLLSIGFEHPIMETYYTVEYRFGSDCEYIIKKMVELGLVESSEDICWDSYYTY